MIFILILFYKFHLLITTTLSVVGSGKQYLKKKLMLNTSITWFLFFFFLVILYSFGFQVIFSMADEYVPEYVDKKALVDRYYTIFLKSKITVGTFDITYSTSLYFIYNSHCYCCYYFLFWQIMSGIGRCRESGDRMGEPFSL